MFIGIQILKDETGNTYEHKVAVRDTKAELENIDYVKFDRIDEVDFAEVYGNVIYTDKKELQLAKESAIREVRDNLLKTELDPVVTNPLRWADMSEEEQAEYIAYRKYLLDYTESLVWWTKEPLTFDEWKKEQ